MSNAFDNRAFDSRAFDAGASWTPATQQSETWTAVARPGRVFDPNVFDRNPIFDTGFSSGLWDVNTIQAETWSPKETF